ncbi:HlyD family type I secretion periplasmic adaptor subunit [Ancylobacter pratisalsi]|uniref:Membrane fusion protein (MFP) family protein n=1 Tax=Ancylobacter pratisalsi TaxID=1745854 RepID=A0A6P1YJ57_9HYPH|nr:HlyD family type I secretion periplasmic adaptor subunit [Ancylobacter pratisalsi]QIB33339.1 HlyD family type I secretion periplasmic adaptor subunit [Ancylobacter pratisalsi]
MSARDPSGRLDREAQRSIRRHLVWALALIALLMLGVGGWASTTRFAGAVIAPGQLVVYSSVKKVQHPTGGIIGELRVKDGDFVKAGDVVVRLDETVPRANLAIIRGNLDELLARQARNEAERDDAARIVFPAELTERADDEIVARLIRGEQRLFDTRRATREGQRAQLRERIGQLHEEVQGLEFQIDAKAREIGFVNQELESVRSLWREKLVSIQRVTALERDATRLDGERGELIAALAQAKGRITETELQILQIDQDMRNEVGRDLADIRGRVSELRERRVAAVDQLQRIDLRAPQDGYVHQLAVHTIGGVIGTGEPVMLIVPVADRLEAEVRVAPQYVDQLSLGQDAVLRLSALNAGNTPQLNGNISRISPDTSEDTKTGEPYYTVRITLQPGEVEQLGEVKLVPGMLVEAFIRTEDRTVLSYLTKPLTDQIFRTFREK